MNTDEILKKSICEHQVCDNYMYCWHNNEKQTIFTCEEFKDLKEALETEKKQAVIEALKDLKIKDKEALQNINTEELKVFTRIHDVIDQKIKALKGE